MLYRFVLTAATVATLCVDRLGRRADVCSTQAAAAVRQHKHGLAAHAAAPFSRISSSGSGRPAGRCRAVPEYEYRTRDEAIQIDVLEFNRSGRGASITVYPLGLSVGPALGLRVSREDLPTIRIAFNGSGAPPNYTLQSARAYDFGASLFVADHSSGWGLGSHAFVGGGIGRIRSELSDGNRYLRRRGWRSQFRSVRRRSVGQVRVESPERTCRSPSSYRTHHRARHTDFLNYDA